MAVAVHGRVDLELSDAGEVTKDRFGLGSAACTYKVKAATSAERAALMSSGELPDTGDPHPYAGWLKLVRSKIRFVPGIAEIMCEFEGVAADTEPIYSLEIGLSEEPIETHPYFSVFAGKPSFPRNGALFVDSSGQATTDDATGVFKGFAANKSTGAANLTWGGVSAYLNFSKAVWKMTYYTPTKPADAYDVLGRINAPPGSPPQFPTTVFGYTSSSRNYLYMGLNLEQRGGAYKVEHSWMLSDKGGWNSSIYGSSYDDVDDE